MCVLNQRDFMKIEDSTAVEMSCGTIALMSLHFSLHSTEMANSVVFFGILVGVHGGFYHLVLPAQDRGRYVYKVLEPAGNGEM